MPADEQVAPQNVNGCPVRAAQRWRDSGDFPVPVRGRFAGRFGRLAAAACGSRPWRVDGASPSRSLLPVAKTILLASKMLAGKMRGRRLVLSISTPFPITVGRVRMATTKWVSAAVVILGWMLATTTRSRTSAPQPTALRRRRTSHRTKYMHRYESAARPFAATASPGSFRIGCALPTRSSSLSRVKAVGELAGYTTQRRAVMFASDIVTPKRTTSTSRKTAHRIEMHCARIELPWHKVKGQPHCDCDDLRFPIAARMRITRHSGQSYAV